MTGGWVYVMIMYTSSGSKNPPVRGPDVYIHARREFLLSYYDCSWLGRRFIPSHSRCCPVPGQDFGGQSWVFILSEIMTSGELRLSLRVSSSGCIVGLDILVFLVRVSRLLSGYIYFYNFHSSAPLSRRNHVE